MVALVAGGLTFVCLTWLDRGRAREAGELRREIAALRAQRVSRPKPAVAASPVVGVAATSHQPSPGAPSPLPPTPVYRNEGRATARAALHTLAWASDRGDVAVVGAMLIFDEPARAKADTMFAALPLSARGDWRTVDDMAAALMTRSGMEAPFPEAEVLDAVKIEEIGADRVRMRLAGTHRDGAEFQRTGAGWSFVITEPMVDRYIQQRVVER